MHDPPEWLQEFAATLVDREASTTEATVCPEPSIAEQVPEVNPEITCVHTLPEKTETAKYAEGPIQHGLLQKTLPPSSHTPSGFFLVT